MKIQQQWDSFSCCCTVCFMAAMKLVLLLLYSWLHGCNETRSPAAVFYVSRLQLKYFVAIPTGQTPVFQSNSVDKLGHVSRIYRTARRLLSPRFIGRVQVSVAKSWLTGYNCRRDYLPFRKTWEQSGNSFPPLKILGLGTDLKFKWKVSQIKHQLLEKVHRYVLNLSLKVVRSHFKKWMVRNLYDRKYVSYKPGHTTVDLCLHLETPFYLISFVGIMLRPSPSIKKRHLVTPNHPMFRRAHILGTSDQDVLS